MLQRKREPRPLRGWMRWLARLPVALYRARLGWLLGSRFLMLEHRGRRSGLTRRTVLEVVSHDPERRIYYVASAWGPKADWFRNIRAQPEAWIQVGNRRWRIQAEPLPEAGAGEIFAEYGRKYPAALRALASFMGFGMEPSEAAYRALAAYIPVVELRPVAWRGAVTNPSPSERRGRV